MNDRDLLWTPTRLDPIESAGAGQLRHRGALVDGDGKDLLLLIGSGARQYREYLLHGLAQVAPLWLIDSLQPSWQQPYVIGADLLRPLDEAGVVPDREGLTEVARRLAKEHNIVGVLTYDELSVTATAHVAEHLGLPGLGVEAAENCRDKSRTRAILTAAGVPQPRFRVVHDIDHAIGAAAEFGYPVIVKPRGMGMSVGVVRADGRVDLEAAFDVVDRARRAGPPAYASGVLIEEMVIGPEISVDAAIQAGQYHPFCLARKQLGPAPYFEEVGHLVDAGDSLLADEQLLATLATAHQALGVVDGMTHTEVRLTSRGPVIIEVNARLGGDLIPYLGQQALGVQPGRIAAEVATGRAPSTDATQHGCAGIRFLYPPEDCQVLEVAVPEPGAVHGLLEARPMVPPGAEVRLPPNAHLGRFAYVLAIGPTRETCEAALEQAAALVKLRYQPLGAAQRLGGRPW